MSALTVADSSTTPAVAVKPRTTIYLAQFRQRGSRMVLTVKAFQTKALAHDYTRVQNRDNPDHFYTVVPMTLVTVL